MESIVADLEQGLPGFKASFGGEELKRACATLDGALVGKTSKSPLQRLTDDPDLHIRELAFAARQYATATAEGPGRVDHDALYNHALVLQELAGKLAAGGPEQVAFLRQACERYEASLALRPGAHAALYNWGVALSDLARAIKAAAPGEAASCLHLASQKYAASLRANPINPQALNNWGLVLQELSADAREPGARDALVRAAMDKFRAALRAHPDFDRGCYNLGTVFYTFASAQTRDAGKDARSRAARDAAGRALLSTSAQYIALAAALQPHRDVYRRSLSVVRHMLPLPFLRAGYLTAPLARGLGTVSEASRRDYFVLDAAGLRCATHMESSLSAAGAGVKSAARLVAQPAPEEEPLSVALTDIVSVRRCAEPSLPEGDALWLCLHSNPTGIYLVAEEPDAADAWVDALLLASHLVQTRSPEALADALAPQAKRSGAQRAGSGGAYGGG